MAVVVADSFPVRRSSCIIREFAANHQERVICSNFGFPLAERIQFLPYWNCFQFLALLRDSHKFPGLQSLEFNRGFSPHPYAVGRETRAYRYPVWGELMRLMQLAFLLKKNQSILGPEEIHPVILRFRVFFFRISSRRPSLARDFVVTGKCASVASPCEGCGLTSCRNFFSAASRTRCCPIVSPNFSNSVGVRSFSASSVSRSSFLRVSTLISVSFVVVHHMSKLELAIVYKENAYNRVERASWLE